jgi:L-ribulokinase
MARTVCGHVVVDLADGTEIASSVYEYPSGEQGILLDPTDPHLARQNPADYIEGYVQSVGAAVRAARKQRDFAPRRSWASVSIRRARRRSRSMPPARPWRFSRSSGESGRARVAVEGPYLGGRGGRDHRQRRRARKTVPGQVRRSLFQQRVVLVEGAALPTDAPKVFEAAYAWVELARGICAAGHKAMYHEQWGGLPEGVPRRALDPGLAGSAEHYANAP